jgi:hypothetical protein
MSEAPSTLCTAYCACSDCMPYRPLTTLSLLLQLCTVDAGYIENAQARKHGIPLHVDVDLTFGSDAAVLPRGTSRKKMAALIGYVIYVINYHYTSAATDSQPVAARGCNVHTV